MNQKELSKTIKFLNEEIKKGERNNDSLNWVTESLLGLYNLCEKYRQGKFPNLPSKNGYRYVKRIVRINRYIAEKDLESVEHAFVGGVFVVIEGAFIDRSMMGSYFNQKIDKSAPIWDDEIKELGFPLDLKYNTIHRLTNGQGFVPRSNNFNDAYINHPYNWDFLEI